MFCIKLVKRPCTFLASSGDKHEITHNLILPTYKRTPTIVHIIIPNILQVKICIILLNFFEYILKANALTCEILKEIIHKKFIRDLLNCTRTR